MALSRRFSKVKVGLPLDPVIFSLRSSSVTVMRIARPLARPKDPLSDSEYLFSLLRTGEGLTRKSRREDTIELASLGNLTASLPRA